VCYLFFAAAPLHAIGLPKLVSEVRDDLARRDFCDCVNTVPADNDAITFLQFFGIANGNPLVVGIRSIVWFKGFDVFVFRNVVPNFFLWGYLEHVGRKILAPFAVNANLPLLSHRLFLGEVKR